MVRFVDRMAFLPTNDVARYETSLRAIQRAIVKQRTRSFISKSSQGRSRRSASAEPDNRVDMSPIPEVPPPP